MIDSGQDVEYNNEESKTKKTFGGFKF